jgi:hypothetical protein
MEYLIGLGLAIVVCVFATWVGFDRDRVFYATLLIVVATYYILFAAMGGSTSALIWESVVACAFAVIAVAGYKKSCWLIAAGLIGHGLFDSVHHLLVRNPGVPVWWPGFCLSFDVLAGLFLAVLLLRRSRHAKA